MELRVHLGDLLLRMSIIYNGVYYRVLMLVRDNDTLTMKEVRIIDEERGTYYYDKIRKLIEHGMLTVNGSDRLELTERGERYVYYADRITEESDHTNP